MRVAKWGNSLAVRIPKDVVEALSLAEGSEVELTRLDQRTLGITKMSRDEAIEGLRKYRGRMPANYRFDREEANAR